MSAKLENALVIPYNLKSQFEKFLVANGNSKELDLNQILPFTGERTEVNLMNFWGIAENPIISQTATLAHVDDQDTFTHMVYHFETESLSSEVVGALALAICGNIEYYHFDHYGDFSHHRIYEFFEAKDGKNASYEVKDDLTPVDDICQFLFGKEYEAHLEDSFYVLPFPASGF
ncbi:hypothetical protein Q4100_06205 [Acinetobacter baumannii]